MATGQYFIKSQDNYFLTINHTWSARIERRWMMSLDKAQEELVEAQKWNPSALIASTAMESFNVMNLRTGEMQTIEAETAEAAVAIAYRSDLGVRNGCGLDMPIERGKFSVACGDFATLVRKI